MKKTVLISFLFLQVVLLRAQVMGYNDLGILFSSDTHRQGTARSMGMQHAFGALGGDLSAVSTNPASGGVFTDSQIGIGFGNRNNQMEATYNGNSLLSDNNHFGFSQFGFIMVFNADEGASGDWRRVSMGINIEKMEDYNDEWHAKGTGNPTWIFDPDDSSILYSHNEYQKYSHYSEGKHSVTDFFLSGAYKEHFYFGISVKAHNVKYNEAAVLREKNNDGNGNYVDAYQKYWVNTKGDGISFSAGMIVKPVKGLRLGLTYESPVWYDTEERSNMFTDGDYDSEEGYYNVFYSSNGNTYENSPSKELDYSYKMRTPSRVTGSLAYVFAKKGLVSLDVTKKNFRSIRVKPAVEFEDVNDAFHNDLQNVYAFHAGTEWRIDKFSLRAGAGYENSPFKNALASDHIKSFSMGAGYRFGSMSLDVAYSQESHTSYFDFYPQYDDLPGAEQSVKTGQILATVTFAF